MSKSSRMIIFLLCAAPFGWAQQVVSVEQGGNVVPAGTLLRCTLDEPNFSSQTARPGDPVLCRSSSSIEMFGRQLIPRGAYLSARFQNYRDPGHFVGKGWIQLEFTSLTLPGGTFPLNAKVIAAERYRVNGDGKIQGRGHPTRDAVEWAIPVLWPIKVLTLPARGPRPAFKGETRLELRLMDDLLIPQSAISTSGRLAPRSSALGPEPNNLGARSPASQFRNIPSGDVSQPAQQPVTPTRSGWPRATTVASRSKPSPAQPRLTLLVLRGGSMYLVADYWVEKGNLDYTTATGALQALPLTALDMPATRQLNAERGVAFILAGKDR
jgi:hypothetical protein